MRQSEENFKDSSEDEETIKRKSLEEKKADLRKMKSVVHSSMKNVEDLNCSICLDYIVGCKVAVCGHSFCENCIAEWLLRRKVFHIKANSY